MTTVIHTEIKAGAHTPWGPAQQSYHIGEGIIQHSTAGHGGMFVPRDLLQTMPAGLRCNCYAGGGSWFEEDCEANLVVLAFPHLFSPFAVWMAAREMDRSDFYKPAGNWLRSEAGESVAAMARDFFDEHAKDFMLCSSSTRGDVWAYRAVTLDGSLEISFEGDEFINWCATYSREGLEAMGARNITEKAVAA